MSGADYWHEDPHTTLFFCTPQDVGVVKDARFSTTSNKKAIRFFTVWSNHQWSDKASLLNAVSVDRVIREEITI